VLAARFAVAFAEEQLLSGKWKVVSVCEVAAHQHSSWSDTATKMFLSVQTCGCLHVQRCDGPLWVFE